MWGWNPQKPTKQDGNDTTLLSHHPYNFAILPTMHTTKLTTCTLCYSSIHTQLINTTLSTAHSTAFHMKANPYLPCPAAIQFHNNLYSNMPYRPSIVHALHSLCIATRWTISAMHSNDYIQQPLHFTTDVCEAC